jgi:hypothetical protein
LILVGYSESQKGYRLLNPTTNQIVISGDVTFTSTFDLYFTFPNETQPPQVSSTEIYLNIHVADAVTAFLNSKLRINCPINK